jgi:chaperone modulatory protein CbpM
MPLRTAGKLRQDFDLDLFTVGLLLGYLNRIEALERQVRTLKAQTPG